MAKTLLLDGMEKMGSVEENKTYAQNIIILRYLKCSEKKNKKVIIEYEKIIFR